MINKSDSESEDFILYLTIEDTEYEDVEVKVTDPSRPILQQIESLIKFFNLPPKKDSWYVYYVLARKENEEIDILDTNLTFFDYGIYSYESLICTAIPIPSHSIDVYVWIDDLDIKNLRVSLYLYDTIFEAKEKILKNVPNDKLLRLGDNHYICYPNMQRFDTFAPFLSFQNNSMNEEIFNAEILDSNSRLIDYGIKEGTKFKIEFCPYAGCGVSVPIKVTNHTLTTKQIVIDEMKRYGYKRCKSVIDNCFCPLFFETTTGNSPNRIYALLSTNYDGIYDEMCKDQEKGIFKSLLSYSIDTNIFYVMVSTYPFMNRKNKFIQWIKRRIFSK